MMDEVFPIKTYAGRQRRVLQQKSEPKPSKKNESGSNNSVKNRSIKRRNSVTPKTTRKKRLKSPRTKSTTRFQRKKTHNKKTSKGPPKLQNLTFGMFGLDGECRADDLASEDVLTAKSPVAGRKNTIDIVESRIETQTLPASEMGGEDKVSEWLSTQNEAEDRDSADSSIEVMREEVVTAAERKEKRFGGNFFENINKVINIASNLGQQAHKKHAALDLSLEDIEIVDSPVGKTTGIESTDPQTYGIEPSTELGTYTSTVPTTRRSSAVTGIEPSTELGTYTSTVPTTLRSLAVAGTEPSTELGTYTTTRGSSAVRDTGMNTVSRSLQSSKTSKRSADYYTDEMTDSLAQKEKSEKTPGKQTSFAIPRSPLKKNKVKSARKHSDTSLPKSSTRLFQTNIDQTDTGPPDLSSIHGDADREGRLINSEVSAGIGQAKQPIPLTPEIQIVKRQPVPRLTSTPTRKTSTPNNDGYQLAQFELDLSSVSAVHSDEEGLILQQSARDVVSDEHMDLSKTRIDENFGNYDQQPLKNIVNDKTSKSNSHGKGAINKRNNKSVQDSDTTVKYDGITDSGKTVKYDRNNDSLKRKRTTKGPVLRKKSSPNSASRNKSQNRTNKEQSKGMESHQSELAQTLISGKQTNLMQRFCRTSSKGSNSQLSSARSTTNGLFKKSFKSSFRLKTKPPNQNKTNSGSKVKENLPVCDLDGDFVCPRRQIEKCGIHRANDASFLDRLAALPKDDLDF